MDTYETGGGRRRGPGGDAPRTSAAATARRSSTGRGASAILSGPPAELHAEVAMADAIIALTSNKAIAEGQRIDFDPTWFDVARSETPEGTAPRQASQVV